MLDINVLDHIIVTNDGFYSFADDGVIWFRISDVRFRNYIANNNGLNGVLY